MKPLIIVQFDPHTDHENVKMAEDFFHKETQKGGYMEEYIIWVFQGDAKISVHYPHKPISYYFNKLKAWVFLKIWRRKRFSNTSVII